MTVAAILGCAGPVLTAEERDFFRAADPLGFILFKRNCDDPAQVRQLVRDLRASIGRGDAPVLMDQEGGRVARLKPPHWRAAPAAGRIGALARADHAAGLEAARLNAALIGQELASLGITVDCAPVLDLLVEGAHAGVVGDRAFGADPELVADLGRAACEGFRSVGVTPVIKHIPGHGRAVVDSHHELPRVDASLDELRRTDFVPFKRLADTTWGMTNHVVYCAIDAARPATLSPTIIADIIRGEIGFDGLLVTDDLSMKALQGSLGERAGRAIAAGCDIALHCNGKLEEMREVVPAAGPLSPAAKRRLARGVDAMAVAAIDVGACQRRLDTLMASAGHGLA